MKQEPSELLPSWRDRAGITPQEFMTLTGSSKSFIYKAIREGFIKAVRVGPRKLIIPVAEVEKILTV